MNNIELLGLPLIEWIGYFASLIVLISLSLSSIVKLRIYNLIGSLTFSVYGFMIGSLPVGLMNATIVLFNIYYLRQFYFQKDSFDLLKVDTDEVTLGKFLSHYNKDIQKYFPEFKLDSNKDIICYIALRNMNLTGVFIVSKNESNELNIEIDYVTPQYRDFKTGGYIFKEFIKNFVNEGYINFVCNTTNTDQIKYIVKMGFEKAEDNNYLFKI